MSEQVLDLRRSLAIVRQHKVVVGIIAALGLIAGVVFTLLYPPLLASTTVVVVPDARSIGTQVVVAGSDPVLAGALRSIDPPVSLRTLSGRIKVRRLTSNAISITAEGTTATQANDAANAVANSYVAYLSTDNSAVGKMQARVLNLATNAAGTPLRIRMPITAVLGLLTGLLIGAIAALTIGRGYRRLRERDDIADAIGVPVLASLSVWHPTDAARWTRLLEEYKPSVADAWRLRNALHYLGLTDVISSGSGDGGHYSVTILSLSSDRGALALGPQMAAFCASLGIPTTLVIGRQQDARVTATLRTACAAPPPSLRRSSRLRVAVADHDRPDLPPDAMLTVVVAVVDGGNPRVADTIRTTATVLGVSAGAATAEQLAGAAASAAADGRKINGILVADPDSADHTTGRVPQPARPARRTQSTRMTGMTTETRL